MKGARYLRERVVEVGEIEPAPLRAGDVRLAVAYSGVCGTDLHVFKGEMDERVQAPLVMGHEASCIVEEVSDGVVGWAVGDRVVVRPIVPCGQCTACHRGLSHICYKLRFLGVDGPGAFQESWTVPSVTLHRLPDSVGLEEAALVEPLAVACHDVGMARIERGEKVAVLGAGPIGSLIAMVAKLQGADVLVSEPNPYRREFVAQRGITVLDPDTTDLVSSVAEWTAGAGADAVFEVSGAAQAALAMADVARARGRVVIVAIYPAPGIVRLQRIWQRELVLHGARLYSAEDFDQAIGLLAGGRLALTGLVSQVVPLGSVQEALEGMVGTLESMKTLVRVNGG